MHMFGYRSRASIGAIPDFRFNCPKYHSEAGAFLSEYITKQSELYVDIMKYDYTSIQM